MPAASFFGDRLESTCAPLILLAAAALASRRAATTTRPTTRSMSIRPDRREHLGQRRDRDRRSHRRRRQHGRRRRLFTKPCDNAGSDNGATRVRRRRTSARTPLRRAAAATGATPAANAAATLRPTTIGSRAARPPCAPAASGAIAAAPSPARSRHRSPPARSAQSIGWTRKWANSQPSSSAGSIPACGHTSFSSSPAALDDLGPRLGADAQPVDARRPRPACRCSRPRLETRGHAARRPAPRRAGASARRR